MRTILVILLLATSAWANGYEGTTTVVTPVELASPTILSLEKVVPVTAETPFETHSILHTDRLHVGEFNGISVTVLLSAAFALLIMAVFIGVLAFVRLGHIEDRIRRM